MKVIVNTRHDLHVGIIDSDETYFEVKVDCDNTAQLLLAGHVVDDEDGRVRSHWLNHDDLLMLRALVSKALQYVKP